MISSRYTAKQYLQGYSLSENRVIFVFNSSLYGVKPNHVEIVGDFNDWGKKSIYKKLNKETELYWTLEVPNADFDIIKPDTEFKFIVNEKEWVTPHRKNYSQRNNNFVFLPHWELPAFTAHLVDTETIRLTGQNITSWVVEDYKVMTCDDDPVPLDKIIPYTQDQIWIKTADHLDIRRVYKVILPKYKTEVFCDFEDIYDTLYSPKDLGATLIEGRTMIRIFSPQATRIICHFYTTKDQSESSYSQTDLHCDEDHVWEFHFPENLHGKWYDFEVYGHNDPATHYYDVNPIKISDPYSLVNDDAWGRSRVWHESGNKIPLKDGIPPLEDVVAYEVHVEDFTLRLPIEENLKGTIKGMSVRGLKNPLGEPVGFDHLLDMGINVLHLMPVQEYMHCPEEDWYEAFKDDPLMQEMEVAESNYQWGYRTSHALAVENRYRVVGAENGSERRDLLDLVNQCHEHNIAVIIDIVPNHTAENMNQEVEEFYFHFNVLGKQYYYRTRDFHHIGEYGNEVKTENRPMVQKWIIDQCLHFIEEFGIDGFRIDLAGQIDKQTLRVLKDTIGHDKILYGEPWIHSNDPNYENNPSWNWYKADAPITFFQDSARNAFKGEVGFLHDKGKDRGWAGGNASLRGDVMKALTCTFEEERNPLSGINYLDIHDNFALADQFATSNWDGRYAVDQNAYKIAATLLFTSLGPIVLHGGSEIMRSKGSAQFESQVKETKNRFKTYLQGRHDTYNLRHPNLFLWDQKGQKPTSTNQNDYANMYAFWRGLVKLRLGSYGQIFRKASVVHDSYYRWFTPINHDLLGYLVDQKMLVLLHIGANPTFFDKISIPAGKWRCIATIDKIDQDESVPTNKGLSLDRGGVIAGYPMDPLSLEIWVLD